MKRTAFLSPIDDRWLDDYVAGDNYEFGDITVDEDELIAFARRYDPQPFHIDAEAASKTMFGGLIASGWHTASLMMRVFADHYLSRNASLGSPGIDELRWKLPVRPGDRLYVRATVLESRRSASKPDRGIVRTLIETLNQHDAIVMSMQATNLFLRRPAQPD